MRGDCTIFSIDASSACWPVGVESADCKAELAPCEDDDPPLDPPLELEPPIALPLDPPLDDPPLDDPPPDDPLPDEEDPPPPEDVLDPPLIDDPPSVP